MRNIRSKKSGRQDGDGYDVDREQAFTRVELILVLGVVALLGMLAMPLLANNRARSDRAVCQSNLRQIGRAFAMWADDHNGKFAYRTPMFEGGVSDHPLAGNVWFQFLTLSNELRTPKILVCPSDSEKRMASDWSNSPDGGIQSAGLRNRSVGYGLSLGVLQSPRGLLSADRNVPQARVALSCEASSPFGGSRYVASQWDSATSDWVNAAYGHGLSGNVLFNDGSVIMAGREELRAAIRNALGPQSAEHRFLCVLYPN